MLYSITYQYYCNNVIISPQIIPFYLYGMLFLHMILFLFWYNVVEGNEKRNNNQPINFLKNNFTIPVS